MITKEQISSIEQIQLQLLSGTFSAVDMARFYLQKIDDANFTNAYNHVFRDDINEKARNLDREIPKYSNDLNLAHQKLGKLFGLFFSVKDVICVKDAPTTASSKILENYKSPFSATAVQRMVDAGGIITGITNCDEFGMGSASENSFFGAVKNFDHPEHVPGGSSGGAAVSVQSETCLIALGTDTGGSVRQPAAFCNLIGIKPTYGKVSRYGLIAYASSFEQIGILGKNIDDVSRVLGIISGVDEKDSTTVREIVRPNSEARRGEIAHPNNEAGRGEIKVAVFEEVKNSSNVQSEIKISFEKLINQLQEDNVDVSITSFPLLESVVATYYILTTAEASSNLSRYDGVRYGYRSEKGTDLDEMYRHTRAEGFGSEVKKRIMLGTFVLSSGYYDAYFTKAQKVRRLIQEQVDAILETNDFIILPTTPKTAWKTGDKDRDPIANYLADVFTVIANLCGLPSLSMPMGKDNDGLSFGLQIIGRRFEEERMLTFADHLEQNNLNLISSIKK